MAAWYYENGVLASETNWKDGKLNGLCNWYYDSGRLQAEGNWKDGRQDGISRWYYESGRLKEMANYKDGGLLSATCYDENGLQLHCH
jgi:antitoxin component YwqK of YwqJK toxin-antitoxin module